MLNPQRHRSHTVAMFVLAAAAWKGVALRQVLNMALGLHFDKTCDKSADIQQPGAEPPAGSVLA